MTEKQIKRILSGAGISTAKNEVLVLPRFRSFIMESRQGIDGEGDRLRFDYTTGLIRIKEYEHRKVLTRMFPYEVEGRSVKFITTPRRIGIDDVLVVIDYPTKQISKYDIVSNINYVLTLDRELAFDPSRQKMFFATKADYENSAPSPRDPLELLVYIERSKNDVDTYVDMGAIVAIDTYNATLDPSVV